MTDQSKESVAMRTMFSALGMVIAVANNSGCAPVPRTDPKAGAKPFVGELKFVDQKSLEVIHFDEPDERGLARLVISTDTVDFNHEARLNITKEVPSRSLVELIEKTSNYKFRHAHALSTSMKMKVGQFGEATFGIVQDGEKYIVECVYVVPKVKAPSSPATEPKK